MVVLVIILIVMVGINLYLSWGTLKVASSNADILREVKETVDSNTEVLGKVQQLISAASGGLSDTDRDSIVAQLQTVQDSNAAVSAAIDAALGSAPTTEG